MTESIIIIGAGIAGLSAGCYAQMNGYQTKIFELHDKPGGLCTAWKRKGYTFDGCIEWLTGSTPGSKINRLWQELGATQDRKFISHEVYQRIEGSDERVLSFYTDLDRLEQHMKELAPEDTDMIEEFCKVSRKFTKLLDVLGNPEGPSGLLEGIKMGFQMLPFMSSLRKYGKMSTEEFANRFSDPLLRQAFSAVIDDLPDMPAMSLMLILAFMHKGDGCFPAGGSLEFAQAIERRFLDLGGEIQYRSRVERILVEEDRAVGLQLTDGTEHRGDIVISAADGHATIFDMLDGQYVSDKVRGYYDELPIFSSWVQVSLGIASDLSDKAHAAIYLLDEPMNIAGEKYDYIRYRHFCFDPSIAPPGKSALVTTFSSDQSYWKELSKDSERYEAEKKDIAIKVIDELDRRLPGIAGQVEVVDVSTPMTVERYTGNWQGSQEGWLITTDTMDMVMGKGMEKTLPDLSNFYMAGQWVEPGGGVATVAASGRSVIRKICKNDKKKFRTSLPAVPLPRNSKAKRELPYRFQLLLGMGKIR